MNTNDAKEYLARREIPQLFESLLTGLMYYRPDDPIDFLENCLKKARELGGPDKVRWDTFVGQEKKSLPPLNGGQSRRSLFRNVLPESPNFPYRRYDRLPPISQFSIESDSDLSETAELIEEYEVFDPCRPRPKVILVIGGPGSGKGTQSLKIAERYGFQYVSVGELLRKKMIHNATSNRKWSLIAKIITNGELAPQETTITEIKQKIMKIPEANGIVIDGFPRDVGQALSFEDQICTPDLVVFLACANHRLKERLQKRAEQQGRPDDNPKAIDRRLTNFKQNTIPLVKYFQERGLIVTLDADRNEEEVFCDISMTLDNKLFSSKEPAAGMRSSFAITDMPHQMQFLELYGFSSLLLSLRLCCFSTTLSTWCVVCVFDVQVALLELLCDAVASSTRQGKGLVVSGFPRDLSQAQEYEAKMGDPSAVILLTCSPETMSSRSLHRGRSSSSLLASSDTEGSLSRRSESFCSDSQEVTAYYECKKLLYTVRLRCCPD
uniref:Adenylate kinase isoenzyme 5 n=1 Tax=Oryzias sinensis TaxID=183150 RepID=A0A8C7ZL34_9TELE